MNKGAGSFANCVICGNPAALGFLLVNTSPIGPSKPGLLAYAWLTNLAADSEILRRNNENCESSANSVREKWQRSRLVRTCFRSQRHPCVSHRSALATFVCGDEVMCISTSAHAPDH